ncbi:amidohydrolase family protein [Vibrio breoganii]|uniref:amidohydrolase family protein n=1 Tax=Vibrio breoganii TaxID=553239 RepID=UPI000ACAB22C|nr:amidohydrolase family protein [Vibrio breoganii]
MTKQNLSSGDNIPFTTSKESLSLAVPEGSCDCHHHIFDPDSFAYRAEDTTNIPTATVPMYQQLQSKIGFSRNVIVTPSAYGNDNQCTLDAMQQLGDSARAVVTIDDSFSVSQLQQMDSLGVCGIREVVPDFRT